MINAIYSSIRDTLIVYSILLISSLPIYAQDYDNLLKSLDTVQSNELKVSILNELAWLSMYQDAEKSREHAEEALIMARQYNLEKDATYSLNSLANYWMQKGSLKKSEDFFKEALAIRKNIGDSLLIGWSYNNLANLYRTKGDQTQAFEHCLLAKNYLEVTGGKNDLAKVLTSMGLIYQKSGAFEAALRAFNEGLLIRKNINNPSSLADSYLVLGGFYQQTKQYALAKENYHEAEQLYTPSNPLGLAKTWNNFGNLYYLQEEWDSAIIYYTQAKAKFNELGNNYELARTFNNIGQVYSKKLDYGKAKEFTLHSLEIRNEIEDQQGVTECYINLGIILSHIEEQQDSALNYLSKSLHLTQSSNFLLLKLKALKAISDLKKKMGNPEKSCPYLEQYVQLNDSLSNNYQKSISLQFLLEQEQHKRIEEEARNEKLKAENQQQSTLLITGSIIFLLLLATGFSMLIIYRQRKVKAELEADRKNQELNSVRAILEIQDSERKRIARDLHDRLGSTLSWIKLTFQNADEKIDRLKEENRLIYKEAYKRLDEAVELTREIAQDLDSGVLKKFGLVAAIKELVTSLEKSIDLKIEFEHSGINERLESNLEEALYRIIQEVLNNVLKHAEANEVTIQFTRNNGNLNVIIEDNGIGFDTTLPLNQKAGMGIKNIQSRLVPFNGTLDIDSMLGRGTIVIINLPIKN